MNHRANLWQEQPRPLVIPSTARPIRVALTGPLGHEAAPLITALVRAVNDTYRTGVVLHTENSATPSDQIAEQLKEMMLPSLVSEVKREAGDKQVGAGGNASANTRLTATLESLDRSEADLTLVLVVSDEPAPSSFFAMGIADFAIEVRPPTAIGRDSLAAPDGARSQDERTFTFGSTGSEEEDISELLAWLESHLERYRRSWADVPGVERLRPRSPVSQPVTTASPPEQPHGKLPKYEYECKACETRFVIERPMSEASSLYACPFCGGPTRRVYSAPKLLFKADPTETRPVWHTHGVPGSANSFSHAHPDPRRRHGDLEERLRKKEGGSSS